MMNLSTFFLAGVAFAALLLARRMFFAPSSSSETGAFLARGFLAFGMGTSTISTSSLFRVFFGAEGTLVLDPPGFFGGAIG